MQLIYQNHGAQNFLESGKEAVGMDSLIQKSEITGEMVLLQVFFQGDWCGEKYYREKC